MALVTEDFNITPPCDLDAERATLSSLMLAGDDAETFTAIRQHLWATAFYQEDHREIFSAICTLQSRGAPIDPVTVHGELKKLKKLEEVGGVKYLAEILQSMPSAVAGEHYAKIVAKRARERSALAAANALAQAMLRGDAADSTAVIESAIDKLWKIVTAGRPMPVWTLAEATQQFIRDRIEGGVSSFIETGISALDIEYGGIVRAGGYTLIAGRPSMGKSTFIRDLLRRRAKSGVSVGLISVEENRDKIAGNQLAAESSIENTIIDRGRWNDRTRGVIEQTSDSFGGVPFHGIDIACTLTEVVTAAQILATKYHCKIIAIDHIHLISGSNRENRNQQLTEISAAIKTLIKRLNFCGIVAAQLNRPERVKVPDPPTLTDLRDSGSLEEHADAVLMLHREDYYRRGEDGYEPTGNCDVLIRKNRNGCVGCVTMEADLAHQRFNELTQQVPEFL